MITIHIYLNVRGRKPIHSRPPQLTPMIQYLLQDLIFDNQTEQDGASTRRNAEKI